MPKIEVYKDTLLHYITKDLSLQELEDIFPVAKAELDDIVEEDGILKVELNDTNRPDLWSTAGLARQFRVYLTGDNPQYDFFSTKDTRKETNGRKVTVDPKLKEIRPYIVGFAVKSSGIDEPTLKDIIQTQEKLCWNFGRKRRSIAMGVYRSDLFDYPVRYTAVDPDKTKFVPLQEEREMSLREINKEHPKGQEFGHIVADYPLFPYLTGAEGGTLSFPPVINSAKIGAVQVGDKNLFIEMTGTDLPSLLLACSIVACDFSDAGFEILPVEIEYPYDTQFGKSIICPYYFQEETSVTTKEATKMLGIEIDSKEIVTCLNKMGITSTDEISSVKIRVPEYRNDFLHPVDIVEDIMIGRGMDSFEPEMPNAFTVGRLTKEEEFARSIKDILIGMGFQEMIFNYLGSGKDYVEKMNIDYKGFVQIANPMSENYEFVRKSILPALLQSEAVSANAVYPHNIFEIGKISELEPGTISGTATLNYLSFLCADRNAGFNTINPYINAISYFVNKTFTLKELDDPRFIPGRGAEIICGSKSIGFFGEIHPAVLENWGVQVPCAAAEINLDSLLEA